MTTQIQPATYDLTICVDGVWATSGRLVGGLIRDCGATLGDDELSSESTYETIEQAIAATCDDDGYDAHGSIKIDGVTYSWDLS